MEINTLKTKNNFHNYITIKQADNTSPIELLLCGNDGSQLTNLNTTCTVTLLDTVDNQIRQKSTEKIVGGVLSFKVKNALKANNHNLEVTLSDGSKYPSDGDFTILVSKSHTDRELEIINTMTYDDAVKKLVENVVTDFVEEKFNNLSSEDQNMVEIIEARNGNPSLKDRLGGIDKNQRRIYEQPDYIKKLIDLVHFDEVHVKKSSEESFAISNYNRTTGRHLTNVFTKNKNDDYIILSQSYVGSSTVSELPRDYKNYEKVNGNFDTTYPANFTTEIGAKIRVQLSGTEIYMKRYGDNRGGVWEFVIDGDTNRKIQVSTFKSTTGTDDYKIIGGLEDKVHTVEATFIGNDPSNAPTGGTSRGWVYYSASVETTRTFYSRVTNINMSNEKLINVANSNKDFAWLIRKAGSSDEYFFVPEHNGIGTAFKINEPQLLLDGKAITVFDKNIGVSQIGKKFVINQSVYGRDPVSKENLLRIDTVYEVSLNSSVRSLGKIQALTDIEIKDGYNLMLPVYNDSARRLKTSRYNYYPTIKNDGSHTNLIEEKDDTSSYIFTSDVNTNLFSALMIHDVLHSLRTGLEGKFPEGNRTWIEHRLNSTMQKLYNSIFRYGVMKANQTITFDGTFLSGELNNIHNLM
ncbi:hypothetical protein GTN30_06510 [Macrococcoides canis]|uniref:BppU N-terminal domain-containing protein n=1 Tax=Macrococcoides canis TaxID=1855823 RepID=A0AAE6X2J6_9STAP|nr:hypothetical protein [Macrococcus canis]QIH78320.1 hypothetical protein GTN30_06510 [Macrococcus canis]